MSARTQRSGKRVSIAAPEKNAAPAKPVPLTPEQEDELLFLKVSAAQGYPFVDSWLRQSADSMLGDVEGPQKAKLRSLEDAQIPENHRAVTQMRSVRQKEKDFMLDRLAEMRNLQQRERAMGSVWLAGFTAHTRSYLEALEALEAALIDRREKAMEWTHGEKDRTLAQIERFQMKREELAARAEEETSQELHARAKESARLRMAFEDCLQEVRDVVAWYVQQPHRGEQTAKVRRQQILEILGVVTGKHSSDGSDYSASFDSSPAAAAPTAGQLQLTTTQPAKSVMFPPTDAEESDLMAEKALKEDLRRFRKTRRGKKAAELEVLTTTAAQAQLFSYEPVKPLHQLLSEAPPRSRQNKQTSGKPPIAKAPVDHGSAASEERPSTGLERLTRALEGVDLRCPSPFCGHRGSGASQLVQVANTPMSSEDLGPRVPSRVKFATDHIKNASSPASPHSPAAHAPAGGTAVAVPIVSSDSSDGDCCSSGGGSDAERMGAHTKSPRSSHTNSITSAVYVVAHDTTQPMKPSAAVTALNAAEEPQQHQAAHCLPPLVTTPAAPAAKKGAGHSVDDAVLRAQRRVARRKRVPTPEPIVTPPHAGGMNGAGFTTEHLTHLIHSLTTEASEASCLTSTETTSAFTLLQQLRELQSSVSSVLAENVQLEKDQIALQHRLRTKEKALQLVEDYQKTAEEAPKAGRSRRAGVAGVQEELDWAMLRDEQSSALDEMESLLAQRRQELAEAQEAAFNFSEKIASQDALLGAVQDYWRVNTAAFKRARNASTAAHNRNRDHLQERSSSSIPNSLEATEREPSATSSRMGSPMGPPTVESMLRYEQLLHNMETYSPGALQSVEPSVLSTPGGHPLFPSHGPESPTTLASTRRTTLPLCEGTQDSADRNALLVGSSTERFLPSITAHRETTTPDVLHTNVVPTRHVVGKDLTGTLLTDGVEPIYLLQLHSVDEVAEFIYSVFENA